MEKTDIGVDAGTYEALLKCYAKKGDIDSINNTLHESEDKDVTIGDHHLLNIIYELSVNGHGQYIDNLIIHLKRTMGYHEDAINTMLRLISQNQVNDAYKLLHTIPRSQDTDEKPLEIGNFFIKQMVYKNNTSKDIIKICRQLQNDKLNSRAIFVALQQSLKNGSVAMALDILKEFQTQEIEIREQYFWPLMCSEARKGNEYLINIVKQIITNFQVQLSYETIQHFIVSKYETSDPHGLVKDLCKVGLSMQDVVTSVVINNLTKGACENAYEIASQHMLYYEPELFRKVLIELVNRNNINYYVKMVRLITDSLKCAQNKKDCIKTDPQQILAIFVDDLFSHVSKISNISLTFKILNKEGLTITTEQKDHIKNVHFKRISPDMYASLEALTKGNSETSLQDQFVQLPASDIRQLEQVIEQKETKGEYTEKLKSSLFVASLQANDLTKCEEIIEKLKSEGFYISIGMYVKLMDLCVAQNQIEKALNIYQNIREQHNKTVSKKKAVNLALGLVENGRLDEAEKILIENASEKNVNVTGRCHRLLAHLAKHDTYDNVNRFLGILMDNGFIQNVERNILNPLVTVFLNRNDLTGATNKLVELAKKYHCTPAQTELMVKLIQNNDFNNFHRVVKVSRKVHGNKNTDLTLLFIYAECDRINEARAMVESNKFDYKPEVLKKLSDTYVASEQPHVLEKLLDATANSIDLDRNIFFEKLLDYYWKKDLLENAMALWHRIEKESFTPTDEFLVKLGLYLQRKKVLVPFEIPKYVKLEVDDNQTERNTIKDNFVYYPKLRSNKPSLVSEVLESDDVPQTIEAWKKLYTNNVYLNEADYKSLLEKLAIKGQFNVSMSLIQEIIDNKIEIPFQTWKRLLKNAANAGYVAVFEEFSYYFTKSMNPGLFENLRCEAYVAAGKSDEYLDKIIQSTKHLVEVTNVLLASNSAVNILSASPELTEKCKFLF